MKNFEATVLDIFAYLVPGASCVIAVFVPLWMCGLVTVPELAVGDALLAILLFYMIGVLCSTLRPGRFASSITGTTESGYAVHLTDGEFKHSVERAISHFCGKMVTLTPWTKEKHFMLRFLVEDKNQEAGDFIRRQSALRQMRYNIVVPVVLFVCGMTLGCVCWFGEGKSFGWVLPRVGLAWIGGIVVIRGLYVAARGNIHREVIYVFSCLVALYWREQSGRTDQNADETEEDAGVASPGSK